MTKQYHINHFRIVLAILSVDLFSTLSGLLDAGIM